MYLHGLGSDWSDFSGAATHRTLSQYRMLVPSLPGHGRSDWNRRFDGGLSKVVDVLEEVCRKHCSGQITIIGHSLGGALAIILAQRLGETVSRIISVEGNLVEGDCGILSTRTALAGGKALTDEFFDRLDEALQAVNLPGYGDYRRKYRKNLVSPSAWQRYTDELIAYCKSDALLTAFCNLRCRKTYLYGGATQPPPLKSLMDREIPTVEIPKSAHWPMYSNSDAFLDALGSLV
jgi:pimeloyl-ACP methyl ester carboxylesterase